MDDKSMIEREIMQLREKCMASESHSTQMLNRRFKAAFKFDKWSEKRITAVKSELVNNGIFIDKAFETEGSETWLKFKWFEVTPPDQAWMDKLLAHQYDSETEVAVFFVRELCERLGYTESDMVFEKPTKTKIGSKKEEGSADLVLYDGEDRADANQLVLVELKVPGKDSGATTRLLNDARKQARSYIYWNPVIRYIITNGDVIEIFKPVGKGTDSDELLLATHRADLVNSWHQLYLSAGKEVLKYLRSIK